MRLGLFPVLLVTTAALIAGSDVASARPRSASLWSAPLAQSKASSLGAPNAGTLRSGEHLEESQILRVVPAFAGRDTRWGLPNLVQGIERAAREVNKRFPNSMLSVGDISRKGGGEIGHHKSHQSGRDVDLGFYMVDRSGAPVYTHNFLSFDAEGNSTTVRNVHFDDARNWALIEELLTDSSLHVLQIFVAAPLRQRLLKEAERRGVSLNLRLRAAQVLVQPRTGVPHDNHFHLRIDCPPGQGAVCETSPRRPARSSQPPTPAPRQRAGTSTVPASTRRRLPN